MLSRLLHLAGHMRRCHSRLTERPHPGWCRCFHSRRMGRKHGSLKLTTIVSDTSPISGFRSIAWRETTHAVLHENHCPSFSLLFRLPSHWCALPHRRRSTKRKLSYASASTSTVTFRVTPTAAAHGAGLVARVDASTPGLADMRFERYLSVRRGSSTST